MAKTRSFRYDFLVRAPLAVVAAFHRDTRVLPRLTPPPIFVQVHSAGAPADGAVVDLTLWFGPLPLRWQAVHSRVDPLHGFTDVLQRGPMALWQHTHRFDVTDPSTTRISEHILYAYHAGWRGLAGRLLFNPLALRLLFLYRSIVTRWALERGRS
jgi:ligand-binding SRPBCC domain-containing protein